MPKSAHIELCSPHRRWIRSDGVLYLLLLLLAFAAILLTYRLADRYGLLRLPLQAVLYSALALTGYFLYRHRLVEFRYTLTEDRFLVERIVGKKAAVLLDLGRDVPFVVRKAAAKDRCTEGAAFHGKKTEAVCLEFRHEGRTRRICISPSPLLYDRLREVAHED